MRLLICTTTPDQAAPLLRQLVEERVVACGNIVPGVRSFYWWEGEVQDELECLLVMETSADGIDAKIARIEQLHSYEVPKIVALDPREVLGSYLSWVVEMSGGSGAASG